MTRKIHKGAQKPQTIVKRTTIESVLYEENGLQCLATFLQINYKNKILAFKIFLFIFKNHKIIIFMIYLKQWQKFEPVRVLLKALLY